MQFKEFKLIAMILLICVGSVYSQEDQTNKPEKERGKFGQYIYDTMHEKKARSPFNSDMLLEHQTIVNNRKKTLEFVMQHRFGVLNSKKFDLLGIYGASNIRIGLTYSLFDKLQLGFGTSKNKLIQDVNWKVALIEQTRTNKMPIALSYYGNFAVEGLEKENYAKRVHRFSYYHEVMLARKFNKAFSLQLSFSYAHFNVVDSSSFYAEGDTAISKHDMKHDNFSLGVIGKVKVSDQVAIIFEFDQPLTFIDVDQAKRNISLGVEISTSGHSFQIFASTYSGLVPQRNMVFNQNDFTKGDIMLGFNITRLWNF